MRSKNRSSLSKDRPSLSRHRSALSAHPTSLSTDRKAVRGERAQVADERATVRRERRAISRERAAASPATKAVPHATAAPGRSHAKYRFRQPLGAILDEAAVVARFVREHARSVRGPGGVVLRPGLDLAGHPRLGPGTADAIEQLVADIQRAQLAFAARPPRPTLRPQRAEAERRVRTLARACAWWADLQGTAAQRAFVKRLRGKLAESRARDALAEGLESWTRLAEELGVGERGVGGVDARAIAEGRQLARALRATAEIPAGRGALVARNRALAELEGWVTLVRAAARVVGVAASGRA